MKNIIIKVFFFDYFLTTSICTYSHLFTLVHTNFTNEIIYTKKRFSLYSSAETLFSKWWSRSESNQRHKDFQSFALPTELRDHLVAGEGFEPTTSGLWARRATRLLYPAIFNSMAEELGFEPRRQFPDLPVFKTGPFNHLGIPPSFYFFGGPCRTRTYDPPVMSRMLWPTELRVLLANWWRGRDSNSRPSGYEPDALAN